ncbi:MAG: methylenetetrahydrofolate reductase, partial [Clostridia bacterium]|nr:methylenetetrahydrofolate reductase [Clostridia bacterium]
LIRELKESGADFCIGGACYPEIHPESTDQREDLLHIREKVEAGCDFLTTQMFFDNALLYNFLYKLRDLGVTVPVVAGIMPITNAVQVERAIKLSGAMVPQRVRALVDRFGSDPAAMKQAGVAYATDQIIDLIANGVTNVHVYSMNKPDVAAAIQSNLSAILGR